jgi:hypothetical protein
MGDLREHDLPKRYRICCLSCCEHDTKRQGAETIHYCREKTEDEEDDCASLKKTVGDKDLKCRCLIFKLPKKAEKKEKWRLVPEESRTREDDEKYHFDCFCVVDTDAKE